MQTIRKWYNYRNRQEYSIGIKLDNIDENDLNIYICVDTCEYCYGFFARDGYLFRFLCTDKKYENPDEWADMWQATYRSQLIEVLEDYKKCRGFC